MAIISQINNTGSIKPEFVSKTKKNEFGTTKKSIINNTSLIDNSIIESIQAPKAIEEYKKKYPDTPKKKLGLTDVANILTAANTVGNVVAGIYGAKGISELKPELQPYAPPVEPELIESKTSALYSAGNEKIDKSINTARAMNERNGIINYGGVILGKDIEARNELGANLAQYETSIDQANAQIKNNVNQQNDLNERQRSVNNLSATNQFAMNKAQLQSAAITGISNDITQGTNSIINNANLQLTKKEASLKNDLQSALEEYESIKGIVTSPELVKPYLDKITTARKLLSDFYNNNYRLWVHGQIQ